jgi:hypothetical protein
MIDASTIAGWIAYFAFWVLLPYGWMIDELTPKSLAIFVALWLAGWLGLPYLQPGAGSLFLSWVALLDIALVFVIFKGDVRIT